MEVVSIGGLLGLVILILDILALIQIISASRTVGYKLVWSLLIIFLPVIGLILYALLG